MSYPEPRTKNSELPRHLGLILDGNRRWAAAQNLPKLEGHRRGYDNLRDVAEAAFEAGVEVVSAYIFSTENWNCSKEEVGYLMDLVLKIAEKDLDELIAKNYRAVFVGSRERVSARIVKAIDRVEEKSRSKTGGTLALCFNYGGHQEIVDAVKQLVGDGVKEKDMTVDKLNNYLYHPELPQVDFVIRTSGEQRLSNFMLWRIAYAELYFIDKHWPAFTVEDLHLALKEFARRQRRFGK